MRLRRFLTRALTPVAAAAASLAFAAPALAVMTIPLNPDHAGTTAADFGEQDCDDENFADLPEGFDGWHFVLPTGDSEFVELTLTFDTGSGEVDITIPDATDEFTDFFREAGGQVKHAYLFTPAGWTLVDGSAVIDGSATFFNLSHVCAGVPTSPTPTETPSPTPTTESPSPTPTGTGTPSESPTGTETPTSPSVSPTPSGPGLPVTGAAATTMALTGVGLIGGGAALVWLRRRRDITFTS
jgi:LPXTG-motif cell wall-anchored protein